jgi:hypothetical protein
MELGIHNMTDAVKHFWTEHLAADGAWSILALDALLLVPVIFFVFFYPLAILGGVGTVAVLGGIYFVLLRALRKHHIR